MGSSDRHEAMSSILGPPPPRHPLTVPRRVDTSSECCGAWAGLAEMQADTALVVQAVRVELDEMRAAIVLLDVRMVAQGERSREEHQALRQDIREALGRAREAQASIPDLVESTGEHALEKLRVEVLRQRADSQSAQLRRVDDRRWQVTMLALGAILTTSIGALAGHFLR